MSNAIRALTFFAAVAAFLAAACSASAKEAWTLVQAVGDVSVTPPGTTPIAVKPSMPLPDGTTVRTGETGRAVLLRGRETIVMAPSSVLTLPSGAERDFTKVRQVSGTLLFKIGKKPEAHFEVDTPYLAAVVKGTTFTVKVVGSGASVHVLEGAVEVATVDRKNSFLTRAGQISSVFAKATGEIFTSGASLLNSPSGNSELWGTDVSGVELGGESSPWTMSTDARVFNNSGLKAHKPKPESDKELTERAPERFVTAVRAANETMGSANARTQTQKPKVGASAISETDAKERGRDAEGNERGGASAKPAERKSQKPKAPKAAGPAPIAANVWTVTQAKGDIKIDGYAFTNFGEGLVRTLPPGTKVETGPDSRLGVAYGLKEFVIDANSLVVLADAHSAEAPKVVSGVAVQYREETGRYEAVENLSPDEVAALRASGALDNAPSKEGAEGGAVQSAGSGIGGKSAGAMETIPLPKTPSMPTNTKTEEVRTKVIGGLTLGLYGLTALLVTAFGAQWIWRRYRAKAKAQPAESVAQSRLRNIKGV